MTAVLTDYGSFADEAVQRCPFPLITRMHEEAPVYKDPRTGFYVVSKYEDIAYVSMQTTVFSSRADVITGGEYTSHPAILAAYANGGWPRVHTLISNDPPDHNHFRAIVEKVFAASFVKQLEPAISVICDELIDAFIADGTVDLHRNFCIKLPMFVIVDQLGLPREDWPTFKLWSDTLMGLINPALELEERLKLVAIHIETQKFLARQRGKYLAEPTENLLSRLANANVNGVPLTETEFISVGEQFLVAGNETTTGAIGHAVAMLIRDPDLMGQLRADPNKIGNFVEEVLRLHAPSPHLYRQTTQDVELSGVIIPKDSVVMLSYLGGNYDPAKFTCPEKVDLGRPGIRNHLAFGRGIHYCVGNLLARAELRIALDHLIARLGNITFDPGHPEPRNAAVFHTHQLEGLSIVFESINAKEKVKT